MTSSARLSHLIALLDDEDADVRAAVLAQLETYGPALDAELERCDIRLTDEQNSLLRSLLRDEARKRLLAAWPGWTAEADDDTKLESSLALLSEYQLGRVAEGALGRLLEGLAEDYRDLTTLRDPLDLARYLFRERGYRGAEEDYYNPLNSSLVHVLETKRGLPISLVCIYILVGRRLGMRIEGCNFPGHFLAFVPRGPVRLVVDCFDGGRVLDMRALAALNPSVTLDQRQMKQLECTAEVIVARVLRNLANACRQARQEGEAALMEQLIGRFAGSEEGPEEA
jgi:regulator of sirC expression with transglutaminase-like and TPR domain